MTRRGGKWGVGEASLARPGLATSWVTVSRDPGVLGVGGQSLSTHGRLQPGHVVCNWGDGQEPTIRGL